MLYGQGLEQGVKGVPRCHASTALCQTWGGKGLTFESHICRGQFVVTYSGVVLCSVPFLYTLRYLYKRPHSCAGQLQGKKRPRA